MCAATSCKHRAHLGRRHDSSPTPTSGASACERSRPTEGGTPSAVAGPTRSVESSRTRVADYLPNGGYDSDKENSAGARRRASTRRPLEAERTPMAVDDWGIGTIGRAETATMSRLHGRWVDQLTEAGQLPPGAGRDEAIKALGAQRQRAEAYAAAAELAAPWATGCLAPVAEGSSVPDGLEATAAAAMTLGNFIKLPSYSMARVASEVDDFIRLAPFPTTNVSPAAKPMPEVPDAGNAVADPGWRPSALADVYTPDGIRRIMEWFDQMRRYEENGIAKTGSGLRQPDDLVLDDDYVQPAARGRPWYLLDRVRSGGALPIVPLEDAAPLAPVIRAEHGKELSEGYHARRVIDQLCDGHRNMSRCPAATVLRRTTRARCAFTRRSLLSLRVTPPPNSGGFSQSWMRASRSSWISTASEWRSQGSLRRARRTWGHAAASSRTARCGPRQTSRGRSSKFCPKASGGKAPSPS